MNFHGWLCRKLISYYSLFVVPPRLHTKSVDPSCSVVPLGLEPRLFWTKTRRVASYTMGQYPPSIWESKDRLYFLKLKNS